MTHMQTESSGRNTYPDESTNGSTSMANRPRGRRVSTETKAAFKTTEFFIYVLSVIAVLVASTLVGNDSNASVTGGAAGDYFRADRAWLFITILTVGYMISRGIAKSGSKDYYDDDAR